MHCGCTLDFGYPAHPHRAAFYYHHLSSTTCAASRIPFGDTSVRILIADDEPLVAEGLRSRLKALGHSVAAVAYDGEAAVAKAAALHPDLILLDIKMPKLDGIAATERIMATRPVPIILVTAHCDDTLVMRAVTAGAMGYLVKPVDRQHLLPAIALATARFRDRMALRHADPPPP
jgi:response regulator NasT